MSGTDAIDARELAALATLRRLSLGAAHSLNNAFAGALGEIHFLLDERKEDPEVVEACQIVLEALERSVRIARGLLAQREAGGGTDETDLGQRLPPLFDLLRETLGSCHTLTLERADDWLAVRADPAELDLVFQTLVQYAADASGEMTTLAARLDRSEGDARFRLDVTGESGASAAAAAIRDPDAASRPLDRTCLAVVHAIVRDAGGRLHADPTGPDTWSLLLRLPAIADPEAG